MTLTVQDLQDSDWQAALDEAEAASFQSYFLALASAATRAEKEGRDQQGRVLRLLSFALAVHLDPISRNVPFKPMLVGLDGKPATIPGDFTDEHLAFFEAAVDVVDDPWIKARLADLLWMDSRTKNYRFATAAIDSYTETAAGPPPWPMAVTECMKRAASLARMLGAGAGSRLVDLQTKVENAIQSGDVRDGYFILRLADVLAITNMSDSQCDLVGEKLASLGALFAEGNELHVARDYVTSAAEWFGKSGNAAKQTETTVDLAEFWAKEAAGHVSEDPPGYLVGSDCYVKAIHVYQTISGAQRDAYQVDQRISELRNLLTKSHEMVDREFATISTEPIDVTDIAEAARDAVRNLDLNSALYAFGGLTRISCEKLRKQAIEHLTGSALLTMIPKVHLDHDGRVIARSPALLGPEPTEDDVTVISAQMAQLYGLRVMTAVSACILPALDLLTVEHPLTQTDFINLARKSPIVPSGRAILFGKALFFGYESDYATAVHLLTPQIENLVRVHLKQAGAVTTYLDQDGIETENGLSALIEVPKAKEIFGEDIAYEIKALFCERFGPNLRNNVAHGLLDDYQCQTADAVYAWWFALKLVFNTYLRTTYTSSEANAEANGVEDQAIDPSPTDDTDQTAAGC